MNEDQESAAWGTPTQQPVLQPEPKELPAYLVPATPTDVALFSPLVYDDITYCDFNHILTVLSLDESMNLLRNYGYVVDWSVEVPTEHNFRFDGILAYHMYQDGSKLAFNDSTSAGQPWPPTGSPWLGEAPNDDANYAEFNDYTIPARDINRADPRRVEGYNLTRLPQRIRAELETAFGSSLDSRLSWFQMAGCNDARIAWLTSPLPRTAAGTGPARRCFTAQALVDTNNSGKLVKVADLFYSGTGTAVGRTGSKDPGAPSVPGPVGNPLSLASQINPQPVDFRSINDGIYGPRWHETSVMVEIPNPVPPHDPPTIFMNPWEPAFFDADFSTAIDVVPTAVNMTTYTLTVNTSSVSVPNMTNKLVHQIVTDLTTEWNKTTNPPDITRFTATDQVTHVRLVSNGNIIRYPVISTGTGPCRIDYPTLTQDGRTTTWNFNSTDMGNALSFVPSNAYAPPKYRSPFFRHVLTGYGTDPRAVHEKPMQQRVHDYWTNPGDTGYLDITSPAALPVPQWYINGHEQDMTFSDLAVVSIGANAYKFSFDTMQSDPRFAAEVARYFPIELGLSGEPGAWNIWVNGSEASGYDIDCREALWNSFAFRTIGNVIGLAYQATAAAFMEAGGYPLNGFHYRHQYKATWTYPSHASYQIQTSPWDWGDCSGTHQGVGAYGQLLQQWRWGIRNADNEGVRPGALVPVSFSEAPPPNVNLMTVEGNETGYTAFAQHYGAVVSAAAASRKPIITYIDQSWFKDDGTPVPEIGNLHGTFYWHELILHSAMQGESGFPIYWYNTDNITPAAPATVDGSRAHSEGELVALLEELDAVLGTGQVIPHIPRPIRFQDAFVLTTVDSRGKFISRLTPHALANVVTFEQMTDSLTVEIRYSTFKLQPQRVQFQAGRLLQAPADFPKENAPKGYWIEQERLYKIPGPDAWEFQQTYIRRQPLR